MAGVRPQGEIAMRVNSMHWVFAGIMMILHLPTLASDKIVAKFLDSSFDLIACYEAMPEAIKLDLRKRFDPKNTGSIAAGMAEPDEEYNFNDIVDINYPYRRFNLGGNSGTTYFLFYDLGCRVHEFHFILYDLSKGKCTLLLHCRVSNEVYEMLDGAPISSIEMLKDIIRSNSISHEDAMF
jgi:hypothetical protein